MNLAYHMARAGRAFRDRPAVALGTTPAATYGETADRVARLAGALGRDLAPGDRVGLVMRNHPRFLEVLYACWHAGLVAVPANAKLHPAELRYILENSGARICFATADLAGSVAAEGLERVVEVAGDEYDRLLAAGPADLRPREPGDPAWLFYTSGTTGRPKGAVLSHRNLLAMCACYFADVDQGSPWRSIVHAAPMSHGSGLYGIAHVIQGSCHVVPESGGFEPAEIFDLLAAWPGASLFAAPTMVKRLVGHPEDRDASGLKCLCYGGGPMYVADCRAALDRFGPRMAQLYGQGESPMTITALDARTHAERDHPRWLERLASVGIPQSAVAVRVAGPDDAPLPPGEVGEVLVRGDAVMSGYWRNPEATAATLAGGWLHTGDVGAFDEDGFLTLKDRSKDLIISGGTNIYPREVEEVLLRHPAVAEVSVIGRPDPEWGETVVAYVVPATGSGPDFRDLDRLCLDHLARFKRPKHYRTVDALPKNNYGKVLKTALREMEEREDR